MASNASLFGSGPVTFRPNPLKMITFQGMVATLRSMQVEIKESRFQRSRVGVGVEIEAAVG
jgi:hypothetical protein